MDEFVDRDLDGARFERVRMNGATFDGVKLDDARFRRVWLNRVRIRGAMLHGASLVGVELCDVVINGDLQNVLVNGVDIAPLVEAELNRRSPDRQKMRPTDPAGFREAWDILLRRWDETITRARSLPEESLHQHVDGEWSFIETLRHLGFASAAWVDRMILGDAAPWHPFDLPWDEAPGWDGIPWDREVRPSLADVLELRARRQATVGRVIDGLTAEQLASIVSRSEPGWPQETMTVADCLSIVVMEEWEHRGFAERDLDALASSSG